MMKKTRYFTLKRPDLGRGGRLLGSLGLAAGVAFLALGPAAVKNVSAQDAEVAEEESTWERSASVGLTLTKGNSETILFSGSVEANKDWDKNELSLSAFATYGEVEQEVSDGAGGTTREDVKNEETFRGIAQYNRLITDRAFGYLRAELFHDGIADIAYRLTLSPGAGYYFIKNEKTTLRGEVGPGWVLEKQDGESTDDYFTLRLAERFEHKFNKKSRIWQSAEVLPQVDDFENYIINAELGVESALTDRLSLRVVLQDTYDNRPAEGRDHNDVKLISSLAYTF